MNKKNLKIIFRILGFILIAIFTLYLIQDYLIFPGAIFNIFNKPPVPLIKTTEVIKIKYNNNEIEIWCIPHRTDIEFKGISLFFHGNGGNLANFEMYQDFFSYLGYDNCSFDYRGFGNSAGKPSDAAIKSDIKMVFETIKNKYSVPSKDIVIIGLSIGTGYAAYLANQFNSNKVILFAPYSDLNTLAKDKLPLYGIIDLLLNYNLNTIEYLKPLKDTQIIIFHGDEDNIIDPTHSERIIHSLAQHNIKRFLIPGAGHNDLLLKGSKLIEKVL